MNDNMESQIPFSVDILFIIGNEGNCRIFRGNKLMLFMNNSNFLFNKLPGIPEVQIFPDLNPEGFKTMLRYLLTSELNLSSVELAWETLHCAQFFGAQKLLYLCGDYITNNASLNSDNIFKIFETAETNQHIILKFKCKQYLDNYIDNLISSNIFKELKEENIETIACRQTLNLKSEYDLYLSIVKWSYRECERKRLQRTRHNVRNILSNVLRYIRFQVMTMEELVNVLEGRVFKYNEIVPILAVKIKSGTNLKSTYTDLCPYKFERKPQTRSHQFSITLTSRATNKSKSNKKQKKVTRREVQKSVEQELTFAIQIINGEMLLTSLVLDLTNDSHAVFIKDVTCKKKNNSGAYNTFIMEDMIEDQKVFIEASFPLYLQSQEFIEVTLKVICFPHLLPSSRILTFVNSVYEDGNVKFRVKNKSTSYSWPCTNITLFYAN